MARFQAVRLSLAAFAPFALAELELQGATLLRCRVVQALGDVPRRIEIEYFWAVPADAFARSMSEGIARNADAATPERMAEPLAKLDARYADVEPGERNALARS